MLNHINLTFGEGGHVLAMSASALYVDVLESIHVGPIMADWQTARRRSAIRKLIEATASSYEEILAHLLDNEFEPSLRTVQRDVKALEEEWADDWVVKSGDRGRMKRFAIKRQNQQAEGPLQSYIINQAITQLKQLGAEAARDAVDLLSEAVPVRHRRIGLDPTEEQYVRIGEYVGGGLDVDVLRDVVDAIKRQELIRFTYHGNGVRARRSKKLPLRIVDYMGRYYVIVWSQSQSRYEPYRIDGITDVQHTTETGEHRFDFATFMATRFGLWEGPVADVTVEIADPATAANFRERRWHPTQRIESVDGGGIRIHMRCGMSPELTSWIFHWTPKIRVIAPESLRQTVMDMHRAYLTME